jgi:hypothetical protein
MVDPRFKGARAARPATPEEITIIKAGVRGETQSEREAARVAALKAAEELRKRREAEAFQAAEEARLRESFFRLRETIERPTEPPEVELPQQVQEFEPTVFETVSPEFKRARERERARLAESEFERFALETTAGLFIGGPAVGAGVRGVTAVGRQFIRTPLGRQVARRIGQATAAALGAGAIADIKQTAETEGREMALARAGQLALFGLGTTRPLPVRLPKRLPSIFAEGRPAPDILRIETRMPKLPTKAQLERLSVFELLPGAKPMFKPPTRAATAAEEARRARFLLGELPRPLPPTVKKPTSLLEPLPFKPAFRIVEEPIMPPPKLPFTRTKKEVAQLLKGEIPFDKSVFVGETSIKARINPTFIKNLPKPKRDRIVRLINKRPTNKKQLSKLFRDLRKEGIEVTPPSKRGAEVARVLVTRVGERGEEVVKFITTEAGLVREPTAREVGRRLFEIGKLGKPPKVIEKDPFKFGSQRKILTEFDLRPTKARVKGVREALREVRRPIIGVAPKRRQLPLLLPKPKIAEPEKIIEKDLFKPKLEPFVAGGLKDVTLLDPLIKKIKVTPPVTPPPRKPKPPPPIIDGPPTPPPRRPPPPVIPPPEIPPPRKPPPGRPPPKRPPPAVPPGALIQIPKPSRAIPPLFEKPKKKKKRKPKFRPSLLGIEIGKIADPDVEKKLLTGLEVRGVKKRR